jgi:hypothetical protein
VLLLLLQVIEDVDKDRRYAIDAAIVRTMKSRKVGPGFVSGPLHAVAYTAVDTVFLGVGEWSLHILPSVLVCNAICTSTSSRPCTTSSMHDC